VLTATESMHIIDLTQRLNLVWLHFNDGP